MDRYAHSTGEPKSADLLQVIRLGSRVAANQSGASFVSMQPNEDIMIDNGKTPYDANVIAASDVPTAPPKSTPESPPPVGEPEAATSPSVPEKPPAAPAPLKV